MSNVGAFVKLFNYFRHCFIGINSFVFFLGINTIEGVRILNRYDAENITKELFDYAVKTVFSEPQLDDATADFDANGGVVFATEYLPGQFDQRADSAAQCIQLISQGEKPTVNSARVYVIYGNVSADELKNIIKAQKDGFFISIHGPYYINLGSINDTVVARSVDILTKGIELAKGATNQKCMK